MKRPNLMTPYGLVAALVLAGGLLAAFHSAAARNGRARSDASRISISSP